jgi:tripartite-type tricarboxylate transporter receptor subunit TctC
METRRRKLLKYGLALGAVMPAKSVFARDWPARPVEIITTNSAGSAVDIIARQLAVHLSGISASGARCGNSLSTRTRYA